MGGGALVSRLRPPGCSCCTGMKGEAPGRRGGACNCALGTTSNGGPPVPGPCHSASCSSSTLKPGSMGGRRLLRGILALLLLLPLLLLLLLLLPMREDRGLVGAAAAAGAGGAAEARPTALRGFAVLKKEAEEVDVGRASSSPAAAAAAAPGVGAAPTCMPPRALLCRDTCFRGLATEKV